MNTNTTNGASSTSTSRSEKEQAIIGAIKKLPKSVYGDYHYNEELKMIVAKAMGYEIVHFSRGLWNIAGFENPKKARIIMKNMEKKGIIKFSKNGTMFRYIGE